MDLIIRIDYRDGFGQKHHSSLGSRVSGFVVSASLKQGSRYCKVVPECRGVREGEGVGECEDASVRREETRVERFEGEGERMTMGWDGMGWDGISMGGVLVFAGFEGSWEMKGVSVVM